MTNVNRRFRTMQTERVVSMSQLKGFLTGEEMKEIAEAEVRQAKRKLDRDRHFSAGHLRNVVEHMPHIRRCRLYCRVPRRVPQKVLATVIALHLV